MPQCIRAAGSPQPADSSAQDERVARALTEGRDYTFLPQSPGTWRCYTPEGACLLVTVAGACTCPDHSPDTDRRCVHSIALGHKLIADGIDLVKEGVALAKHEALLARIFA
jgi:hypothetical protein